jgi:hypothetical protein
MTLDPATVMPSNTPTDQLDRSEEPGPPLCIVLLDGDRVTGVLPRDWVLGHPSKLRAAAQLGDVALRDYVTISKDATIVDLLALLVATHAAMAVVVSSADSGSLAPGKRILGVITKATLAETLAEGMELFGN